MRRREMPLDIAENAFVNEPFVRLRETDGIALSLQYPAMGIPCAPTACYLRKGAYERLCKAARLLPEGYRFCIWDAWRPFSLQQYLYELYAKQIEEKLHPAPAERAALIASFVSPPVENRTVPPVHTTGGAVDLTMIDASGEPLDMGTAFDDFSHAAHTAYYENRRLSQSDIGIRDHRRLLYNVMTAVGFTNLPSEWWHYDFGDRFWGYYKKKPAVYSGVFDPEELYADQE